MDKQVRYIPDITSFNKNNRVENEKHHLKRQIKNRIIVPVYGCFYKNKLVIRDVFNKKILKHKKDYFLGGYRPNYSKFVDGEIYSFIIINNDKVSESISIDYQAYGVHQSENSVVTTELLENGFPDNGHIPFSKLKNLPLDFNSSFHYHDIGDIKKFELMLFYLDKIRFCIIANNKELMAYVQNFELTLLSILERANTEYENLVFKKIKDYYDSFSLSLFGLDKLKNYSLMNHDEGFTIGNGTHKPMFGELGEKYFSLKALEGLSKAIYSLYTNKEETNLGYYNEKLVVPSVDILESMPIGACITIPAIETITLDEEIKKLYPDLSIVDCRYLVKKVASRGKNKNSCYLYVHRDNSRTFVMVGNFEEGKYKTKYYKIASSLDGQVVIDEINKHILDYDNPHLDDKRDVNLSMMENLPIATKEDVICNLPVRKYITLRNLLLFMKRFKTGTKEVTEIYENLSPQNETRMMQTIFSACGSWKNIDVNKIELCKTVYKEEEPWIRITESTVNMWEAEEQVVFTIECSNHYLNKEFVYKLTLDSNILYTDALTIEIAKALDSNFSEEFERWTRVVGIEGGEGLTDEELIFKTFVKTFITLQSNTTQITFKPNFRENPIFRSIKEFNNSEVYSVVAVKNNAIKTKLNLYDYDGVADAIGDLIASSAHVTIKPDPSALEILVKAQDGGDITVYFKIVTDNYTSEWLSYDDVYDQMFAEGRFQFLETTMGYGSEELFLMNGFFLNLANFRDDATGKENTGKVKVIVRAGWIYPRASESEIVIGDLPLKIEARTTAGGYRERDLLTTIEETIKITNKLEAAEEEPYSVSLETLEDYTQEMCTVEYDMLTRRLTVNGGSNSSTTTTSTTSTTSTTTTTSSQPPETPIYISVEGINSDIGFDDEAQFKVVIYFVPHDNYKLEVSLVDYDKITLAKDTDLVEAFENLSELEPKELILSKSVYVDNSSNEQGGIFKFKTKFTLDNKFFLRRFALLVKDKQTNEVYYGNGIFHTRFVWPDILGFKPETALIKYPLKEEDSNYLFASYCHPEVKPPPDEIFWNYRKNGIYSSYYQENGNQIEEIDIVACGVGEDNRAIIHTKIVGAMPGYKKESDYRNINYDDIELRFFTKRVTQPSFSESAFKPSHFSKEVFLPYFFDRDKNILAIQLKPTDFTDKWVSAGSENEMLVTVLYGKPRRNSLSFKIFLELRVVNYYHINDVPQVFSYKLVANRTEQKYGGDVYTPSPIMDSPAEKHELSRELLPIYRPRTFSLIGKNGYTDILEKDVTNLGATMWVGDTSEMYNSFCEVEFLLRPYLKSELFFNEPIDNIALKFYNYGEKQPYYDRNFLDANGMFMNNAGSILEVNNTNYKYWKERATLANVPISLSNNSVSSNRVDIKLSTNGWIEPGITSNKTPVITRYAIAEITINDYWVFLFGFQFYKSFNAASFTSVEYDRVTQQSIYFYPLNHTDIR